ncbi:MAG: hypothetical protein RLO12_03015 [Fulvivirga sp.]|uniref:hypothetical protein n=1 Tax=Fulvivirga sp. TaxID=1931237 RepID=UPI0032F2A466
MKLSFKQLTVQFINEPNYNINSSDNLNSYHLVHFAEESQNCTNCHGIKVTGIEEVFSAIVLANGGTTGIHSNCAIIQEEEILICCGDHVFCLSLPTLELKWKVKVDMATAFQIQLIKGGYIVHGELEISRIDLSGNIIWQQSGTDIFVHPEGAHNFKLLNERVEVTDWNNRKYCFDLVGNLLN